MGQKSTMRTTTWSPRKKSAAGRWFSRAKPPACSPVFCARHGPVPRALLQCHNSTWHLFCSSQARTTHPTLDRETHVHSKFESADSNITCIRQHTFIWVSTDVRRLRREVHLVVGALAVCVFPPRQNSADDSYPWRLKRFHRPLWAQEQTKSRSNCWSNSTYRYLPHSVSHAALRGQPMSATRLRLLDLARHSTGRCARHPAVDTGVH